MNSSLVSETICLQHEKQQQQQQKIFAILKLVKGGGKKNVNEKCLHSLWGIWRVKE